MNNQGIAERFSIIEFAKAQSKKQMTVAKCINKQSGEEFSSVVFHNGDNDENKVFVSFSSKLDTIPATAQEIVSSINDWQIVKLANSGNYKICKKGANTWESVELF